MRSHVFSSFCFMISLKPLEPLRRIVSLTDSKSVLLALWLLPAQVSLSYPSPSLPGKLATEPWHPSFVPAESCWVTASPLTAIFTSQGGNKKMKLQVLIKHFHSGPWDAPRRHTFSKGQQRRNSGLSYPFFFTPTIHSRQIGFKEKTFPGHGWVILSTVMMLWFPPGSGSQHCFRFGFCSEMLGCPGSFSPIGPHMYELTCLNC